MCDLYAMANPMGLREVPKEFMKDEYIDCIFNKEYHLGVVPYEYRTVDVCMKFVKRYRSNIEFVPDEVLGEVCEKMGISYHKDLNLDNSHFWMKRIGAK